MYFFSLATTSPWASRITTPYEAGPGLPREPPSMLARCEAAFGADAGSAGNNPAAAGGLLARGIRSWSAPDLPRQKQRARAERWVRGCTESNRNFHSEIPLHYLRGAILRRYAAARASRSRG